VVDLSRARHARRVRDLEARRRAVDELNRRALGRLFQSGMIFTRSGARLARDLLLAHQHLLRIADLLERIGALGADPSKDEADPLYVEAHHLLSRTTRLTARTAGVLARR
jgi:phosphate uptake regulator